MSNGDDGDKKLAVVDLVNDPVVTNANAPGLPASELFTTWRSWVLLQLHHFILDTSSNSVG
jgi:hypothetical protein